MPVAYGGGVRDLATATRLIQLGVEKIVRQRERRSSSPTTSRGSPIGSGSSTLVVSIDAAVRPRWHLRGDDPRCHAGNRPRRSSPRRSDGARSAPASCSSTSVDRDGTMDGYDLDLVRAGRRRVDIPVVACGGAGSTRRPRRGRPRRRCGRGRRRQPLRVPRPPSGGADHLSAVCGPGGTVRRPAGDRRAPGQSPRPGAACRSAAESGSGDIAGPTRTHGGIAAAAAMIAAHSASSKPSFLRT